MATYYHSGSLRAVIIALVVSLMALSGCDDKKTAEKKSSPAPVPAPVNEPTELFPPNDGLYEIVRVSEPATQTAGAIEDTLAAGTYQVVDRTAANYTVQEVAFLLEVFRFPSDMHAFGFVSARRPSAATTLNMGSESFVADSVLYFSNGPFAVRLTCSAYDSRTMAAQSIFADRIHKRFGINTPPPPLFMFFPLSARVVPSNRFTPKSYLGIVGLDEVYSVDYQFTDAPATFFLSPDSLGGRFITVRDYAAKLGATSTPASEIGFDSEYVVVFDHPTAGKMLAGLVSGKLIGVVPYREPMQKRLLFSWVTGMRR